MKKIFHIFFMFFFIVLVCFLFGELTIRIFYNFFSNYNTEMWRYSSKIKTDLPNDRLPFFHQPNKEGTFYGVKIKTNSMGFRDYEYSLEKPSKMKRILFIGDSFTLGWGVPLENLFSKQIEKMLAEYGYKVEVINAGVGNYNSIMQLELFKLKGLGLSPDLVVLMYFLNDVEPTPPRMSFYELFFKKRSYFFGFLFDRYVRLKTLFNKDFNWKKYYIKLYQDEPDALVENRKALIKLFQICRKREIELLVVNIPELRMLSEYPFPFATEYIKNLTKEEGIEFVDLLPSFQGYDPRLLWVSEEDPHANSKANTIIAKAIFDKICSKVECWFSLYEKK